MWLMPTSDTLTFTCFFANYIFTLYMQEFKRHKAINSVLNATVVMDNAGARDGTKTFTFHITDYIERDYTWLGLVKPF